MEPLSLFPLLTVVGGSGFLGRAVVETFAAAGWRVRVVTREPERAEFLRPLGDLGQISLAKGDIRQPATIRAAMAGTRAAINLVGILDEKEETFDAVARGAGAVAAAAALEGVEALLHVSAVGARADGETAYQRSKAAAEDEVRRVSAGAAIVRPTLIFGPEDQFSNRFGQLAGMGRYVPVIHGESRIQPVYVGDVARGIAAAIERQLGGHYGETCEFAGPEIFTIAEFVDRIIALVGVERIRKRFSPGLARFLSHLPGVPVTKDQITLMGQGSLPDGGYPGLEDLGVVPTPFGAVAGAWLGRYRPGGRFFAEELAQG